MVNTPSTMLPLGTTAPPFRLADASGREHSLDDFAAARGLVVAFVCNHCPFVIHLRSELASFARDVAESGVSVIAISANDVDKYPQDGLDKMAEEAETAGYTFPYVLDETQEVAKAYRAACTPDFFLFDDERRLAYRGQFDASRPGSDVPVTGADLRGAVDRLLAGAEPAPDQKPSLGCNIKWKPGNEPDYFAT